MDETTDKNAVSGYNLKFTKEQDSGKDDYAYSLDISYANKTGEQEEQYSLLIGTLRIWEENNGKLADFINNTISQNHTGEDYTSDTEKQKDINKQGKSGYASTIRANKEEKTKKEISHNQASFLVVPYSGLLKEKTSYNTTSYYVKIQIDATASVYIPVSLVDKESLLYVPSEHYLRYKNHLLANNLLLYKTPYQSNGQINISTFENDLSHLLEKTDVGQGEEHLLGNTIKKVFDQKLVKNDAVKNENNTKTEKTNKQKLIKIIPYKGKLKNVTSKETEPYYCKVYSDDNSERFIPVSYSIESGELFILEDYVNRYQKQIVIQQLHLYKTPWDKEKAPETKEPTKEKNSFPPDLQKKTKSSLNENTSITVKANSQKTLNNDKKSFDYHFPPTRILVNSNGEVCPSCGYSNYSQWKSVIDKNGDSRMLTVCCCKNCNTVYMTQALYDSFKNSKERYKFDLTFKQSKAFEKKKKKNKKTVNISNYTSEIYSDNDNTCPYCGKKYDGQLYNDGVFGFGLGMCRKCYMEYRKSMND